MCFLGVFFLAKLCKKIYSSTIKIFCIIMYYFVNEETFLICSSMIKMCCIIMYWFVKKILFYSVIWKSIWCDAFASIPKCIYSFQVRLVGFILFILYIICYLLLHTCCERPVILFVLLYSRYLLHCFLNYLPFSLNV